MVNQPDSSKRLQKEKKEDQILYRMFWIFLAGIVAETYLLFIQNKFMRGTIQDVVTGGKVIPLMGYIGLAAFLVGGGLLLATRKKVTSGRRLPFAILTAAGAFLGISSTILWFLYETGISLLLIAVPALTVLGIIYYLYQHEFFLLAVLYAASLFALWGCRIGMLGAMKPVALAAAGAVLVLLAIAAAGVYKLQKARGSFKGVTIFSEDCNYVILYASIALCAAAVVLSLVFSVVVYYAVWTLAIALFLLAVYYTAKLM